MKLLSFVPVISGRAAFSFTAVPRDSMTSDGRAPDTPVVAPAASNAKPDAAFKKFLRFMILCFIV